MFAKLILILLIVFKLTYQIEMISIYLLLLNKLICIFVLMFTLL